MDYCWGGKTSMLLLPETRGHQISGSLYSCEAKSTVPVLWSAFSWFWIEPDYAKEACPSKFMKIAVLSHTEQPYSCMCSWNVPRFTTGKHQLATKNNTLQAVGCEQQIILNSRGFFFKHHFLTSVLVKCVHGEYKAKTNKPRVFEQSLEQPLQMAFAMKEGLAVNAGLPRLKCHWASPSTKAAGQVR